MNEIIAIQATQHSPVKVNGKAGTGKTHLINELVKVQPCIVVTFTNKAASVLRERGIAEAGTIHSKLYRAKSTGNFKIKKIAVLDSNGTQKVDSKNNPIWTEQEDEIFEYIFDTSKSLDDYDSSVQPWLVIDEASMVPSYIWERIIEEYPYKIVMVGDENQLPPVEQEDDVVQGYFDLFRKTTADITLTFNHRQNQGSSIPIVAESVLKTTNLPYEIVFDDFMTLDPS